VSRAAPPPAAERLLSLVARFRGRRVLVLADLVADEFLSGRVQRVSREAPVLILEYDGTDVRLGGGANAAHNIRTLGGRPLPLGVLGRDDHGRRLRALLRETGIGTGRVVIDPGYVTPVKTRILGGGTHSTKQQMVRIDKSTHLPSAWTPSWSATTGSAWSGPTSSRRRCPWPRGGASR
jgi:bifunctional ADP-heptose synthase (sugar kinase/adenylyltransferase)